MIQKAQKKEIDLFAAFWNFVDCLLRARALRHPNLLFNCRHFWLHWNFESLFDSFTMAHFQQSGKTGGEFLLISYGINFFDTLISGVRLHCNDGIFLLHGFHCPVCWPRWIFNWRIRASICSPDCCRGIIKYFFKSGHTKSVAFTSRHTAIYLARLMHFFVSFKQFQCWIVLLYRFSRCSLKLLTL